MGSSDEPGGRMAIGTSLGWGKDACAIAHSASDGLITCGHGGNQGLKAQRCDGGCEDDTDDTSTRVRGRGRFSLPRGERHRLSNLCAMREAGLPRRPAAVPRPQGKTTLECDRNRSESGHGS